MWLYELFVLPPDTASGLPETLAVEDTGNVRVNGEYSFGTEGATVRINVYGEGWFSRVKVVDVAGVSGEVKRVEELQELNLTWEYGNYGITGGILTRDLLSGRVRGEGVEVYRGGSRMLYLRRYSPPQRRDIVLVKDFAGPYVFSEEPTIRKSLRVFLNGRQLKEGEYTLSPEGNAIYLRTEFGDGDLLTVEYQRASLSPSHVIEGTLKAGITSVRLYHERPALKVINGCTADEGGDYVVRGDTFLLVPGRGNLSCTFVPSENGRFTFAGDRYVPSENGDYVLVPPDTSPKSSFAEVSLLPRYGRVAFIGGKIGDTASYGGRWDLRFGSGLQFITSGDVFRGRRPDVSRYNGNLWGGRTYGEAALGLLYDGENLLLGGKLSLGIGDSLKRAYTFEGGYRWLFGRYERFPARVSGEAGVRSGEISLSYDFQGDTSGNYRGGNLTWRWFRGSLRRYGDGFWGYSLRIGGGQNDLFYSITPKGRSLMGRGRLELRGMRLTGAVSSSQSFLKQERFVYVGKGWGDYEKDSTGNFVPYPYGSYRKEVLYFPAEEPTYDFSLSASGGGHGLNLSGKWGKRIERYDLLLHSSGEVYRVSLRLSGDLTSTYTYSERRTEGRAGRPVYVRAEVLSRRFGADSTFYVSSEVGYTRGWVDVGVEGLRGKSWALSPIVRTRGNLYGEAGYRMYFGEAGSEARYKPPGPFVSLNLNLTRNVGRVRLTGTLTGGYDVLRKGFYTFSFGVSGEI